MTISYSFPRYLSAKRTVDDRALNQQVWHSLQIALADDRPIHILEIGGGTGSMFQRMVEWGLLKQGCYTMVDADAENIAAARQELPEWGLRRGMQVSAEADSFTFSAPDMHLTLELVTADLFAFIEQSGGQAAGCDLLVAHAFLDLVDIPTTLPLLRPLLHTNSLLYLTINFDGLTIFEPPIDPVLDESILTLYHQSMDARETGGSSRTGRRMFTWLPQAGFKILAAGSSDWTVFPQNGGYAADEAYFLHFILHFLEDALSSRQGLAGEALTDEAMQAWLTKRHAQIDRGQLTYLAHQYDFLAALA